MNELARILTRRVAIDTPTTMIQISETTPLLIAIIAIPVIAVTIVITYSFMKKRE